MAKNGKARQKRFQSTLPTRGSDRRGRLCVGRTRRFNPRSPRGGATADIAHDARQKCVSIHAPHEGERLELSTYPVMQYGFNPRSPRGGARHAARWPRRLAEFQSTLPTRGSDHARFIYQKNKIMFQSTLPTRGSDAKPCAGRRCASAFQSTLPTRGSD